MQTLTHTFDIVLNSDRQSPSVQKWLRNHFYENEQQPDSILTNTFQNESGFTLTTVILPFWVQAEQLEGEQARDILIGQFGCTEAQVHAFFEEFGQLLHFILTDKHTHLYYMRPLSANRASISIEFSDK